MNMWNARNLGAPQGINGVDADTSAREMPRFVAELNRQLEKLDVEIYGRADGIPSSPVGMVVCEIFAS